MSAELRERAVRAGAAGREPEREALRRVAAAGADPAEVPAGELDWGYLVELADRHGLAPLLAHQAALGTLLPPAPAAAELRAAAGLHLARNLRMLGTLRSLSAAFAERGVPLLAYKGPPLALQAYGGLGLRRITDLDLVVRPADLDAADALLREAGYRPELSLTPRGDAALRAWEHHRGYVGADGETLVELHWRFAQPRYGVSIPAEGVIARAEPLAVAGPAVRVPDREDQVLLLCIHGARHLWERLEWLAAVGRLLRLQPPDPALLLERAATARARRLLLIGLALAEGVLDAPLAPSLREAVERDAAARALARVAADRLFAETGSASDVAAKPELFLFNLRAKDRVTDRARFAVRYLTTPSEDYWFGPRLPDPLFPLYRVYRPFRLAGEYLASRVRGA